MRNQKIRVRMLRTVERLTKGGTFFLSSDFASALVGKGYAEPVDRGPRANKVVTPQEIKSNAKALRKGKADVPSAEFR